MSASPSEQRRDAFRVGLAEPARIHRALGEVAEFEMRDLSVRGARLSGGVRLDLEETVTIEMRLDGEEVAVAAQVVRLDAHGCGVDFRSLTPAIENRISRFLTEQQRRRARPRA